MGQTLQSEEYLCVILLQRMCDTLAENLSARRDSVRPFNRLTAGHRYVPTTFLGSLETSFLPVWHFRSKAGHEP